jgi:glutathione reductase (NADPH)
VTRVEKSDARHTIHSRHGDCDASFDADLTVHSAGHRPALKDLDLKAGDTEAENARIKLNANLRSVSNETVYAAGDAAQHGPPLTPVAAQDAYAVAGNLRSGGTAHRPDYKGGVPRMVFTIPPLARVGAARR